VPENNIALQIRKATDAKLQRTDYYKAVRHYLDDYSGMTLSPEETEKIQLHLQKLSTGSTALIPLMCAGPMCPFASRCLFQQMGKAPISKQCHPPGEKVLTSNEGYVPIEDLDPSKHYVVGYERKWNAIRRLNRKGYNFQKGERDYNGNLVTIETSSKKSYKMTEDHLCIVRFNEKAFGKFCVYLMRKGSFWRIGKSFLLGRCKSEKSLGKTSVGFVGRGNREKADAMWILGVFDTNTEAMLAEEYFSITLRTSKALFVDGLDNIKSKWNGVYKWATKEQLEAHHRSLIQPESFYREELKKMGLSIDFPIWVPRTHEKHSNVIDRIYAVYPMYMRACNILPDIMSTPVKTEKPAIGYRDRLLCEWEDIKIKREPYKGKVFSLNVEDIHTYFVNDIATHNCINEASLLAQFIIQFMDEYNVDPESPTEVGYCNEMAEIEILLQRLNMILARPENAELVIDQTMGFSREGEPITQKQISPYIELKDRLFNRKTKIIKLMVGDRQEKYKKESALKQKSAGDSSTQMAEMRRKIEALSSRLSKVSSDEDEKSGKIVLTPDEIIATVDLDNK
jgi:hypothetical protein